MKKLSIKWKPKSRPRTLAGWLKLALQDLKYIEKKTEIDVNMFRWADITKNGVCSVCLAGAVLVRHTDLVERMKDRLRSVSSDSDHLTDANNCATESISVLDLPALFRRAALAIDYLRWGQVESAAKILYPTKKAKHALGRLLDFSPVIYSSTNKDEHERWWDAMNCLVKALEEYEL